MKTKSMLLLIVVGLISSPKKVYSSEQNLVFCHSFTGISASAEGVIIERIKSELSKWRKKIIDDKTIATAMELLDINSIEHLAHCQAVANTLVIEEWAYLEIQCDDRDCSLKLFSSIDGAKNKSKASTAKSELLREAVGELQKQLGKKGELAKESKPEGHNEPDRVLILREPTSRSSYLWAGWMVFGIGYVGQFMGIPIGCGKRGGCIDGQEMMGFIPVFGGLIAYTATPDLGEKGGWESESDKDTALALILTSTVVQIGGLAVAIIGHAMPKEGSKERERLSINLLGGGEEGALGISLSGNF